MAKTIAQLRTEAQTIKNATIVGENTATRVGGFGEDIVDYLEDNPSGATFATGEDVGDVSLFDELSDLDGKTSAEKALMLPNGKAVDEIVNIGGKSFIKRDITPYNDKGECASNNGAVGATASLTFAENNDFSLIFTDCAEGDRFALTCAGGNTYVAYTILDANNKILATSGGAATLVNEIVVAPSNAAKIVIHNNFTLSATFAVYRLVEVVDNVDTINDYFDYIPQPSSEGKFGRIAVGTGVYTSLSNTYHSWRLRKFAVDPTKRYVADIFVPYASGASQYCGVAYYTSVGVYIDCEYNDARVEQEYKKVPLHIPPAAAYCWIIGGDAFYFGRTKGQLYLASGKDVDFASHDGEFERTVWEATLKGNGTTPVVSSKITLSSNRVYKVYATPKTWTMPQPTATTTGFAVVQYCANNANYTGFTWVAQNDFVEVDGFQFFADPLTIDVELLFRALATQYVTFRIVEVMTCKDVINATKIKRLNGTTGIEYHIASVKSPVYDNGNNQGTALDFTDIESAWGIVWPQSYTQDGKPTQVIAMLHGSVGYVTPTVLGYSSAEWIAWRNAYLAAGFAVMDINGWGVSTASDSKSQHWGCPIASETIDKAFEYLKQNYNVADKLLLHGTSMGGAAAWSYALTHAEKVAAVALFAPATLSWIMIKNRNLSNAYQASNISWQYQDAAAGVADDFQKVVGYDPILSSARYATDGTLNQLQALANHDVLTDTSILIGKSLPWAVRIWHGTSDETVPFQLSQIVTTAYRNGGNNVTLRICPNATHNLCTGSVQYVIDESIDFMEMYGE